MSFYNDLLFEIYHYIPRDKIKLLNKASRKMYVIRNRIRRYVSQKYFVNRFAISAFGNKYDFINEIEKCGYSKNIISSKTSLCVEYIQSASEYGNIKMIKFFFKNCQNTYMFANYGMYGACNSGNIRLIKYMIKNGANDFNEGLRQACIYKRISTIKLMIKLGANDFNKGLYTACYLGNIKIVKLMIKKGATQCNCHKSMEEHLLKK
jgi:ankyrin repeat protein